MFRFYTSMAFVTTILCCVAPTADAVLYSGSGTSGFGGPIGGSTMDWNDDGTTVTVDFTKGTGDFNDSFVIYIANGSSGRSSIGTDINDRGDANRSAISYMEASTNLELTFPTGFEATHAIAINTGFGGLWSIPSTGSVGDNGLGFVDAVGNPSGSGATTFTFSFDLAEIGLTPNSGAQIDFVATYLNPFGGDDFDGFASNEGYGGVFPDDNIGQSSFSFSSPAFSYVTAVPEPSAFLFGGVVCSFLGLRYSRRRSRTN